MATTTNTQPQMAIKEVTIVSKTSNSVSIRWIKATDKETPREKLAYTVTWCVAPYKWDNNIRKIGEKKYDNDNYVITGLEPNTTYDIIIYVRDEGGYENSYAKTTVTTLAASSSAPSTTPTPTPDPPKNTQPQMANKEVTIVSMTSRSVSIRWSKATDKETPQERLAYTVTWCVAPYKWDNNIRKIGERKYNNDSYVITDLEPDTTYEIIIYVRDEGGTENSYARTTVKTPAEAAPKPAVEDNPFLASMQSLNDLIKRLFGRIY